MSQVWFLALCGFIAITACFGDAMVLTRIETWKYVITSMKVGFGSTINLVFIVDTSSQGVITNQASVKSFIWEVIVNFWLAPRHNTVSVVISGSGVKVPFNLTTNNYAYQVAKAINQIQFKSGSSNTYMALIQVANQLFSAKSSSKMNNVAIVITNGGPSSQMAQNTQAANLLKKKAHVFVVTVGMSIQKGVQQIVTSPNSFYTLNAPNYSSLPKSSYQLVYKIYFGYKNQWDVSGYQKTLANLAKTHPTVYKAITEFGHFKEGKTTEKLFK